MKTARTKGNDVLKDQYSVKVRKLIVFFQKNVDNHLRISSEFSYESNRDFVISLPNLATYVGNTEN